MDGGQTFENLNHSNIFHCGIDRRGNLYTAAMGGAYVSRDCGPGPNMKRPCSWQAFVAPVLPAHPLIYIYS